MSLYVQLTINSEPIGVLVITRTRVVHENFNEYTWRYMSDGRCLKSGTVFHPDGDGAIALASASLGQCKELTAAR